MNRIEEILSYLDFLYPNAYCELNYNKDYELLIAIVLSAQTTDKRVNMVTSILFDKYKSLEALKGANLSDLESIIRSIGSFRKKSEYIKEISRILVEEYDSKVPKDHSLLTKLPGVGRKTANVFLAEYYNYPYIGVDTHVERVSKRLGLASKKDDVLKVEKKLEKCFKKEEWAKRHLQLVLFGRYYCKAIKPECENCKLKEICKEKRKI